MAIRQQLEQLRLANQSASALRRGAATEVDHRLRAELLKGGAIRAKGPIGGKEALGKALDVHFFAGKMGVSLGLGIGVFNP